MTKKGNVFFNNWKQKNMDRIKEIKEKDTLTVFEKLNKKKKTNTIFEKLRFFKEKKHGI